MSGFQILAILLLGVLLVVTVVAVLGKRIGRRVGLFWSLVWMAAGLAVMWPESTTRVAKTLGIDRGANLVLYCFCVLTLVGFFMTYSRLRRLDTAITLITRHLATHDAQLPDVSGSESAQGGDAEPKAPGSA